MRKILAVILLFTSLSFAFDKHNTYMWNRENFDAGNSLIDKTAWFEWWYFKVVLPDTGDSFFLVYGVVNPWDVNSTKGGSRAFIGIGNFMDKIVLDKNYPVTDFSASYEKTEVKINNNYMTDQVLSGSLSDSDNSASWNITMEKKWGFNAMGWAMSKYNIANIYWYPAQASALMSGEIIFNGKKYIFKNAPAYQDRNWGRSFPQWWTWIVSNQFEGHPDTTLVVGGGKPVIYDAIDIYEGVTIGLNHKGKIYEWRPMDLDYGKIDINFGKWEVEAKNLKNKIVISAYAPFEEFMDLQFVTPEGETFHDYETLTGTLDLKLYEKRWWGWKHIDTLYSEYAGIEYGSHDVYKLKSFFNSKGTIFKNK